MGKARQMHQCSGCGTTAPQWSGRCGGCSEWNTLELMTAPARGASVSAPLPLRLHEVTGNEPANNVFATGLSEVDRVLGGGLTPGSVTLLGGEPGIGKSTLALQLAGLSDSCVYISGEESVDQVARRALRLEISSPELSLLAETDVDAITSVMHEHKPALVVIDSIQTMVVSSADSSAGTVAQVKAAASALVNAAKSLGIATVVVGHVTKEGTLAGPRTLEHIVDTVLEFEGDRHHGLRMLRAVKHRFGATGEVGVMEMTETGMIAVPDASGLFLDDRRPGITGSVVAPALTGKRPLLVELQSLVVGSSLNQCRRVAQGLDSARLAVVLAVLHKRAQVNCSADDVYASVVGGVKIDEPATDLPLALAIASSKEEFALPPDLVAIGELGLGGEVRRASAMAKRLGEAQRLGFRRAIVPEGCPEAPPGLELIRAASLGQAIAIARRARSVTQTGATVTPMKSKPAVGSS